MTSGFHDLRRSGISWARSVHLRLAPSQKYGLTEAQKKRSRLHNSIIGEGTLPGQAVMHEIMPADFQSGAASNSFKKEALRTVT